MEVKDFKNYLIYEDGKIYSKNINKYLKPILIDRGYYSVNLCKDGKGYYKLIHRLVAEHFLSNEKGLKEVDHIDRNPGNYNVNNLRWVSKEENHQNKGTPKNNTSGFKCICFSNSKNYWNYSKMINRKKINFCSTSLIETFCFKFLYIILSKINKSLDEIKIIHNNLFRKNKIYFKEKKIFELDMKKNKYLRYINKDKYRFYYNNTILEKKVNFGFINIKDALCFKFILHLYLKLDYDINSLIENSKYYFKNKYKTEKLIIKENKKQSKQTETLIIKENKKQSNKEYLKYLNKKKNNYYYRNNNLNILIGFKNLKDFLCFKFILHLYLILDYDINSLIENSKYYFKNKYKTDNIKFLQYENKLLKKRIEELEKLI